MLPKAFNTDQALTLCVANAWAAQVDVVTNQFSILNWK